MAEQINAGYLTGQLLVAMPTMRDPRFTRTVIFMCAHNAEGAMGLVVNRLVGSLTFPDLLAQLGIERTAAGPRYPRPFRRAGRYRPRLRAAFGRLQRRGHDADRRGRGADRQPRHPARHRRRRRPAPEPAGAGLCRLGRRPARYRDPGQWLALAPRPTRRCCSMPASTTNGSAPSARSACASTASPAKPATLSKRRQSTAASHLVPRYSSASSACRTWSCQMPLIFRYLAA